MTWIEWLTIGLMALCLVGIGVGAAGRVEDMEECLASGRKRFECRAILNSGHATVPPVVVFPR